MSSVSPSFDVVLFTDFTDTVLLSKILGAYKIAHALRQQGHSVVVVDHFHMWRLEETKSLLDRLISPRTVAVGFSTTFFRSILDNDVFDPDRFQQFKDINFQTTFCPQGKDFEDEIVAHIRTINPQCKIVLGGHSASVNNQNRNVDYVITGHGELSMPDLIMSLKTSNPLHNTKRNVWGTHVHHSQELTGEQFSAGGMSWPWQDVVNARVLPIETARGCLFNCKFCSYPMRGKKNLDFVLQEELVYRELQEAYDRFGIDTWSLTDDTFNDSDEKLKLILRAVRRLTFQPKFWCYARLDLMALKSHRIDLMRDIGVRAVHFGIETLDHRTGKLIGKGFNPKRQVETIQRIRHKCGDNLLMHGTFIIGLPGESLQNVSSTYQRCRSQEIPLHTYSFLPLAIKYDRHWQSDFDINYQKYGLEMTEIKDGLVYWKSDITDYNTVEKMSIDWNKASQQDPNFYIPSRMFWSMLNIPGSSFESLAQQKNVDINWNQLSRDKITYVQEYKKSLISWLENIQ